MSLALDHHENATAAAGFVPCKSNPYGKSTESKISQIDRRRQLCGISQAKLCREAEINGETYTLIKNGETQPQRRILIRLARALDRLAGSAAPAPAPEIVAGLYRAAVVTFAGELGADVTLALRAQSLSNFDAANRAAGKARRLAFDVTVNAFEVPRAAACAAVGYSKQAASKALKEIEDAREADAALDRLILRVGALLTGKDLR
jgi:transcriptional regulator with XRE-family HTH domain